MNRSKPFTWIASAIFALMAIVHLYRIIKPFPMSFGSVDVPQWASIVCLVIAAVLSWMLCREARGTSGA
jgi:hypothetical protein